MDKGVNADVRARFGFTISDSEPRILTWDGDNGCRPATDEEVALWDAHADMAGEVRELVEALKLAVRQNEHDMLMTGEELRTCTAVLAKFTQEKP